MCGCGGECCEQKSLLFENDTLGFDWGSVIGPAVGAGTNFGLSWLQSLGQGGGQQSQGGCGVGLLTGDGDIALCLDRMLGELASVVAGKTATEKLAAYEGFLAFMTSPQFFAQGASAHYLGNQIRLFRDEYIPELRRQAAAEVANGTATVVTNPTTGQQTVVPTAAAATGGGIDTTTLLLIGGGAVALMLLTRG